MQALLVGRERHLGLEPVHPRRPVFINRPGAIADDHILDAVFQQEPRRAHARGARAVDHDPHLLDVLADERAGIHQRRQDLDSRRVLIGVKHRNIERASEPLFYGEAPGRRNIVEADAAEGRRKERHGMHDLVHILRVQTDGEGIHSREGLEEHGVAFHDGQRRLGTAIAEIQHLRAVRDDGDGVASARVHERFARVRVNGKAGLGEAEDGSVPDGDLAFDADHAAMTSSGLERIVRHRT